MKFAITGLFSLLFTSVVFSDEAPPSGTELPKELVQLNQSYGKVRDEITKPLDDLKGHYLRRLEDLERHFQEASDLDAVLHVVEERNAFAERGIPISEPPEGEPRELVNARRIYLERSSELTHQVNRSLKPKQDLYLAELVRIEQLLTSSGRIEDAVTVRDFRETVDLIEPGGIKRGRPTIKNELIIKVQVDGVTHLHLRGDTLWFDHTNGRA